MKITVYSKPGCEKCQAAKEKLEKLNLPFKEELLEKFIKDAHEGWRGDGSTDLMAWCCHKGDPNHQLPTIEIDGKYFNYSEAMKELKLIIKNKSSQIGD